MRILLGYQEIAGYYGRLCQGLHELGVEADFIALQSHRFAYAESAAAASASGQDRLLSYVIRLRFRDGQLSKRQLLRKLTVRLLYILLAFLLLLRWCRRYDAFVLGFHSHLLFFWELPLLKLLGKRIIYIYHGSDSRPVYLDGNFAGKLGGAELATAAALQRRTIHRIESYADFIVNNPAQGHFFTRPFVAFLQLGIPFQPQTKPAAPAADKPGVRVLHCPSNPEVKGSEQIRRVIRSLQTRGFMIDWVELIDRPNSEVMAELVRCDLIVDQLYSDTPMAGFATEAAFFGKPAVVAGYYQDHALDFSPDPAPPSYYCLPDELEQTLVHVLESPAEREEMGRKAQAFVTGHWSAARVAGRLLRMLESGAPPEWYFDPGRLRYLHGSGLPEEQLCKALGQLLAAAGPAGLQLDDKPALRQAFLDLVARSC